jgi:hypothetical protein
MHRSASHEDMHERLRRLLYEAFFGVDFDGAAARSPHNERPRLVLISPSRRGAMRPQPKFRAARPLDASAADAPPATGADELPERPADALPWSQPTLERLP